MREPVAPAPGKIIRIFIVEDNLVQQQYLQAALSSDPSFAVIGVVDNGLEAVKKTMELKPDVILLDLFLPGMDGIGVIDEVMSKAACPIIVISGELGCKDRDLNFEAQRSGAVEVMAKPQGMSVDKFDHFSRELCHTVHIMSGVKVTTRKATVHKAAVYKATTQQAIHLSPPWAFSPHKPDLLVIGASTGGPAALHKLLEALVNKMDDFSVLIAQHMMAGFAETFCYWLGNTGCRVKIADNGEAPRNGWIYLASDNQHLVMGANGLLYQVDNPGARFTPSVDMLFESVACHFRGRACAIILTGMGNDGTHGMVELRKKGASCIAEDESSSVIFGMPRAAIAAGAAEYVLPLEEIVNLFSRQSVAHSLTGSTSP